MIIYFILLGVAAFLLSLIGTRLTILALRRKRALLDIPNARSNHKTPTPRGGGIAVVFTAAIFLMIADANYFVIASMLLLAGVSLLDDWMRLTPLLRLIVQFFAVLLVIPGIDIPALSVAVHPMVWKTFLVFAWLWFINLFNFMDGIDGISGAEAISICAGIIMITLLTGTFSNLLSQEALIVFAASAGFLWWNWHPAKIFLGDVGSIPLGFLLAYLLIQLAGEGHVLAAIILPAYYVTDATWTITKRFLRGEKIWQAHSEHFYQQAVRAGRPHDTVVKYVLGVNMLLILLAAHAVLEPELAWLHLSVAYGMVVAVLLFVFAPHNKAEA